MNPKKNTFTGISKNLAFIETIGFSLAGHTGWFIAAPLLVPQLGFWFIPLSIIASLISCFSNLQFRSLSLVFPSCFGGSANLISKLYTSTFITKFIVFGYCIAWWSFTYVCSSVISSSINFVLQPTLSISPFFITLCTIFVTFILAASGNKSLAILYGLLIIPTLLLILIFISLGFHFILSHSFLFPTSSPISIHFPDVIKWYFVLTWSFYCTDTTVPFINLSQNPTKTRNLLVFSNFVVFIVFIFGSYILTSLFFYSIQNGVIDSQTSNILFPISHLILHEWGDMFVIITTCLVALTGCTISTVLTQLSLAQLSKDGLIPSFFSQGTNNTFPFSLFFSFVFSLLSSILTLFPLKEELSIVVFNCGYYIGFIFLHFGFWSNRNLLSKYFYNFYSLSLNFNLSLAISIFELFVLFFAVYEWGLVNFFTSILLLLLVISIFNFLFSLPLFSLPRRKSNYLPNINKVIQLQILVVVLLIIFIVISNFVLLEYLYFLPQLTKFSIVFCVLLYFLFIAVAILAKINIEETTIVYEIGEFLSEEISERTDELNYSLAQLEIANLKKDEFISTISHELRAPLTNIKMAIQMLTSSFSSFSHLLDDKHTSRFNTYLSILDKECSREVNLVNDLLDLQRLEEGRLKIKFSLINIHTLLSNCISSFTNTIKSKSISVYFNPDKNISNICTDESILERVIVELIHNAVKYTPNHESIYINLTFSFISSTQHMLHLTITNTGVSIPSDEEDKIFDRFYRMSCHANKEGGTGLGLYLIRKSLEYLSGSIQLIPSSHSTTFTVSFPINS